MAKLFIEDLPIKGKKVLMRVDFNVPLDNNLNISDATRIFAALPSIKYVVEKGGALILMSHLGRPKGEPSPELSLAPCAKMLSHILKLDVKMAPDCTGSKTEELAEKLQPGEILMLENLRFHRAEEYPNEDPSFAKKLADLGDFYVDDAFGSAHRSHSSIFYVPKLMPGKAAAGYLMEKEIRFLSLALFNPKRPFYAIIGGAKISTKLGVIRSLLQKVDGLLIGGGMAYTFLKAQGIAIGQSLCEDDQIAVAKQILEDCKKRNIPFILPIDFRIANECSDDAENKIIDVEQGIPDGYQGLDIGPKTIQLFQEKLKDAQTILWNGPLGVYEFNNFALGTAAIAQFIGNSQAISIVGGGDSIAAINDAGVADKISHLSTGGGATLEFIEYGTLPGIEALSDN